jgi:hypothetical protein
MLAKWFYLQMKNRIIVVTALEEIIIDVEKFRQKTALKTYIQNRILTAKLGDAGKKNSHGPFHVISTC